MAQIVTITNPLTGQPAQVDQLEHTAQQIDDSIGRALPGGEIDTLLAGKAPAGYGLGETLPTADANEYSGTGFFNSVINSPTAPQRWTILQIHLVLGNVVRKDQLAFRSGSTFTEIAVRKYTNEDGFTPWDYLNPPMKLGVEYRTTERYNGKPVYCKLVNFGKLPNNTYKDVAHGISKLQYVISVSGESNGDNLIGNMYITYVNIGSTNIRIKTNADRSGVGATVLIKYTKTTD